MRRLLALWVLWSFVAATAAPALAACRMRSRQKACCCAPAPPSSVCAPDCCDAAGPARPLADPIAHVRGLLFVAHPPPAPCPARFAPARPDAPPTSRALVGLHERAAPRRPLRI